jgi:AAA domain-containing protein/bifunctional DNA primase/polymerase-like protein/primase-like protein
MLEAARAYRDRGLSVIPACRPTDAGCSCSWHRHEPEDAGKQPLVKWEPYQLEAPHVDQVDEWWSRSPEANIGIVTGAVSKLVVFDADSDEGIASLDALRVPRSTWISRTGRGLHVFLRHPGVGTKIGNRAGLRPKLDVRGDGGYVLAPPSRHRSGRDYEWITGPGDVTLAEIQPTLLALLTGAATNGGPESPTTTAEIPEGQRNDTLYKLARALFRRGLGLGSVVLALLEENRRRCRPPLSECEVRAIAEHAGTQPHRPDFTTAQGAITDDLDLVSIGQLLGEPDTGPAWLVEKRLPAAGLGLLAAKPKGGKSTLARVLAMCVARGTPWLGHATTRGPVVYLALEEKRHEVRDHFQALGATSADPIFILCAAAPVDALARLRREAERRRPALIIIDTLFKLVRIEDGNDYAIVTAALEPLLTLARETGAHVLAVHHLGKGERGDGDAILGSTAIFAAVDTVLLLKRSARYRTLSSIQRYGDDLEEITLALDPVTREVTAGVARDQADLAEASRLILEALAGATNPMTEAELDAAVECRTGVRRKALRGLVGTGTVVRMGRGGKTDPFMYSCSHPIPGNQGTRSLFPDLSAEA